MNTLTIRDLRTRPRQARASLLTEGETVLTANGKPVALMFPVDSGTLDETVTMLRRVRAQQAVHALRTAARAKGLDRLSPAEIDAIIAKARAARGKRRRATGA